MTARRVSGPPAGAPPGALVTFTFDGREFQGLEGEPLAVSLLAADRLTLSRSFRFHRPRGLMCSTGSCGWCECEVDGVPSVRSCRVPVREGLVARGEHAWPSVERDLLATVGLFSRWIPPTFYHHRFLRPRQLRKRYLDVLRWFGGRGRLGLEREPEPVRGRPLRRLDADVLVVGGGRAGLEAALGAAEAGGRVVLIEAEAAAPGPGEMAGAATAAGVEILAGVVAVGWYDGVVTAIGADEHLEIRARTVVAATGSYGRVPLVPGADRPGVMPARAVTALVERHGVLPGERPLLVGAGQELARAGELLARGGARELIGPVATRDLVAVRGRDRVTGADVRLGGRRQRVATDLVVFGDRSPNLDLVLAAGAAVERNGDTLVPVIDEHGRTTVPSLLVVGSASGREASGRPAVDHRPWAISTVDGPRPPDAGRTTAPEPASVARGALVCFCEDVRAWEIRAEQVAGYLDPELVKRRTGSLTGPCQGKYCLQSFSCLVDPTGDGAVTLPTARPPLHPIRLGDLVAAEPVEPAEGTG